MDDPASPLHDISDPVPLLPGIGIPWWLWVLGAIAIGALILLVFLLSRRAKPVPATVEETYENSRRELESLRAHLADRPVAAIATEASLSMRRYLAACLAEPALYETHEEFILRGDALTKLPAGAREHLNPLLTRLAELKYGPSGEDPAAGETLLGNCLEILQGLESTRPRALA
jgi:hypothetical protein